MCSSHVRVFTCLFVAPSCARSFGLEVFHVALAFELLGFREHLGFLVVHELRHRVAQLPVVVAKESSEELLQTIDDYDALLSTDVNFLLGRWVHWARAYEPYPQKSEENPPEYP